MLVFQKFDDLALARIGNRMLLVLLAVLLLFLVTYFHSRGD